MTSAKRFLTIILLNRLQQSLLPLPPCKLSGLCPRMHLLPHLQKPLLEASHLKLLQNPPVPLPFPLLSHLYHLHHHIVALGQLKSNKVSQQDILQISHLPLCQSSTASPPKTLPSLLLHHLLLSLLRLQLPLWSNRLSISSLETRPLPLCLPPAPWKDLNSLLLSLLQQSRPSQSGSRGALLLHNPQSFPHLLLIAPLEISLLLPLPRQAPP